MTDLDEVPIVDGNPERWTIKTWAFTMGIPYADVLLRLQERADRVEPARRLHSSLRELTDGTLRDVFDHHGPRWGVHRPTCKGCDQGDDGVLADWPCSTWNMIENHLQSETYALTLRKGEQV